MMVCGGKNKLLCGNNKLLIIFYKFLGKFSKYFLNNYHNKYYCNVAEIFLHFYSQRQYATTPFFYTFFTPSSPQVHDRKRMGDSRWKLAIENGDLAILQSLYAKGSLKISSPLLDAAAEYGHLHIIQWLSSKRCCPRLDTFVSGAAAKGGHLDVLMWLKANGCPCDEWTCGCAAQEGHLTILKWLRENGCLLNESVYASAAFGGHIDILVWLRENGCPCDEVACSLAAAGGQLNALQWLRKNNCPWDEQTCSSAAEEGHLGVLKWAHENGCPWDHTVCEFASIQGNLPMLQWALQNGCPYDEEEQDEEQDEEEQAEEEQDEEEQDEEDNPRMITCLRHYNSATWLINNAARYRLSISPKVKAWVQETTNACDVMGELLIPDMVDLIKTFI